MINATKHPMFVSAVLFVLASSPSHAGLNDFLGKALKPKEQTEQQQQVSADPVPSPLEELAENDVRKAQTVGAVVGAGAGAIIGYNAAKRVTDDKDKQKLIAFGGAALGSLLGKVVGGKVGKVAADRRRQYASEQAFLEAEIAASEKAIVVRERDISDTHDAIAQTQKRVKQLTAKTSLTQKEQAEAAELKQEIELTIAQNKALMKDYDEKVAYLEYSLKTSKADTDASAQEKQLWEQKYADLQAKTRKLIAQRSTLEEQTQQLVQSREVLNNAIS